MPNKMERITNTRERESPDMDATLHVPGFPIAPLTKGYVSYFLHQQRRRSIILRLVTVQNANQEVQRIRISQRYTNHKSQRYLPAVIYVLCPFKNKMTFPNGRAVGSFLTLSVSDAQSIESISFCWRKCAFLSLALRLITWRP